jgi:copper transport protein
VLSLIPPVLGLADQVLAGGGWASRLAGIPTLVTRWTMIVSLLLLVGCVVFVTVVWRPTMRADSSIEVVRTRFARRARVIGFGAWLGAVLGSIASFLVRAGIADVASSGASFSVGSLARVASTRFGIVTLARVGLLALVAALWAVFGATTALGSRSDREENQGSGDILTVVLAAVVGLGLLVTPGLSGHAGSATPVVLNLFSSTLHLAAAACWIGGLVMLVIAVYPATAAVAYGDRVRILGPALSRFSDMAVLAVGVLVVSGSFRSWAEVRTLSALTGTAYGIVLLGKVAAFLPMLGLGALNNRWLKPRLQRAADAPGAEPAPLVLLRRMMVLEVTLAALVLGTTAVLVNLAPPRAAAGSGGTVITHVRTEAGNTREGQSASDSNPPTIVPYAAWATRFTRGVARP